MKFPNFLFSKDISRVISKLGRMAHFALLSVMSFLFSLRIPSGTIQLMRESQDDRICDFAHQSEKILVGVRTCNNIPTLVVKFPFRKNLPGGCILRRFCTCEDKSESTRRVCHPRLIWPIIAARTEPGELRFPKYTQNNFNRRLKFILTKIKFIDDRKFTSKAFRRGPTQEIVQTGNNLETAKGSGGWHGAGFLSYVDTEIDAAFKAQEC